VLNTRPGKILPQKGIEKVEKMSRCVKPLPIYTLDMTQTRVSRAARAVSACVLLLLMTACVEGVRDSIPFLPPSKYVDVGGRKLTREEVAYYQKIKDLSYATKVNPKDAVAYVSIGELFQQKGNYNLAKDLYLKALSIDDTLSAAHSNLGIISMSDDRYNEALDYLTKAKTLSPHDARIRMNLGVNKAALGRLDEAVKEFDEAIALDPEFTPAYLEKARLLYKLRRFPEATDVCRTAIQNVPKLQATVVKAQESRGNFIVDKIFPTNQSVEQLGPPNWRAEASFNLALCLKAQGQYQEGLTALAPAETEPVARLDTQILKARLQEGAGSRDAAVATLEALRREFPYSAEVPKRLAKLYQEAGKQDLAFKTRLDAAELDHSDRTLQEEAARAAESSKDTARAIAVYERLVRLNPDDIANRHKLARSYDEMGIVRQAALTYQEIVSRQPEDVATRRRLGFLMADLPGFTGRSIIHFKQVLERNPRDVEVHRKLGELYLQTKNYPEAEQFIRSTLQYQPKDPQAMNNLATLYVGQKRYEDAVSTYQQALLIDPNLQLARMNMAKVMLGINRKEEAVPVLRDYLKLKPLDAEVLRMLADTLRDLGRKEDAIKEYEALYVLKEGDAGATVEMAKLQSGLGKDRTAIGLYETILEKNPAHFVSLRENARLYTEQKMPLRAIYCWQRILNLKPGDLEAQSRLGKLYRDIGNEDAALKSFETVGRFGDSDAWRAAAEIRLARKEKDEAIKALREAMKLKQNDANARRELAQLLREAGTPEGRDEASQLLEEVLQIDPKDTVSRLNFANLLSESNQLARAQEEYDAVLQVEPQNSAALLGLGVVWRKRGKYEKALDTYHLALKSDPNQKLAHYNIAIIYDYYMGDPVKAQFHYGRFLELGGERKHIPADAPGAPKQALEPNAETRKTSAN